MPSGMSGGFRVLILCEGQRSHQGAFTMSENDPLRDSGRSVITIAPGRTLGWFSDWSRRNGVVETIVPPSKPPPKTWKKRWVDPQRYASADQRLALLIRDRWTCRYCRIEVTWDTVNFDHVRPWKFGGPTTMQNLVTSCQSCNKAKGNKRGVKPRRR